LAENNWGVGLNVASAEGAGDGDKDGADEIFCFSPEEEVSVCRTDGRNENACPNLNVPRLRLRSHQP